MPPDVRVGWGSWLSLGSGAGLVEDSKRGAYGRNTHPLVRVGPATLPCFPGQYWRWANQSVHGMRRFLDSACLCRRRRWGQGALAGGMRVLVDGGGLLPPVMTSGVGGAGSSRTPSLLLREASERAGPCQLRGHVCVFRQEEGQWKQVTVEY